MDEKTQQVDVAERPTTVEGVREALGRLAACPRRRAVWLRQARRRLLGTRAHPDDAIQEALARCLNAPEKYDVTKGEVAVWVGNTLETVLTTMRRMHLRRAEDFDERQLAQTVAPSEGPERLVQLRESLEYLRAHRLVADRFANIVGATELDGRSMLHLADEMGTSEGALNTYKHKQRSRLKEHRPHLLSLIPLMFVPGADGAEARKALWDRLIRGTAAFLKTAAVVVPLTVVATVHVERGRVARSMVTAPAAPVQPPAAVFEPLPRYAVLPEEEAPSVEAGEVMLAVARTPPAASVRSPGSDHNGREEAGQRAQRARQAIDQAVAFLEAGRPEEALRRIENAARLAPNVEPDHRESRRCLALRDLRRSGDAQRCAAQFLARWPTSIFAAQMREVQSPP